MGKTHTCTNLWIWRLTSSWDKTDDKPLSSSSVIMLWARLKAVARSSQMLFPILPFPLLRVMGGVEFVTSIDRVGEDGIWTGEETTTVLIIQFSPLRVWSELRKGFVLHPLNTCILFPYFTAWSSSPKKKNCKVKRKRKTGSHKNKTTYFFLLDGSFPRRIWKAWVQGNRRTNDEDRSSHQNPRSLKQRQGQLESIRNLDPPSLDNQKL